MPEFEAGGRRWHPRVTWWTIEEYERQTNIGLLEAAFRGLDKEDFKSGDDSKLKVPVMKIVTGISNIFGGRAANVARLAYLSIAYDIKDGHPTLSEFSELLDGPTMAKLVPAVWEAYQGFFQGLMNVIPGANMKMVTPDVPGAGATSTSLPPSDG